MCLSVSDGCLSSQPHVMQVCQRVAACQQQKPTRKKAHSCLVPVRLHRFTKKCVCVCVCVCVFLCVCVYVLVCVCVCVYLYVNVCVVCCRCGLMMAASLRFKSTLCVCACFSVFSLCLCVCICSLSHSAFALQAAREELACSSRVSNQKACAPT